MTEIIGITDCLFGGVRSFYRPLERFGTLEVISSDANNPY